jgi:hypothetical protein
VPRRDRARHDRDERGQATLLIVGFAVVLAMAIAVVVDASAAYLQRQSLDTVADGAALRGADLGATGREVYTEGVPADRLRLTGAAVRAAVHDYLARTGAYGEYPGLSFAVGFDARTRSVTVHLRAPVDLPLTVPGSPSRTVVGATGSAVVVVGR